MPEQAVETKLAAILAADVAGYSRLIGGDEEGTAGGCGYCAASWWIRSIAKDRGRIVKTTGDGMLVEFASTRRCAALCIAGAAGDDRAQRGYPAD